MSFPNQSDPVLASDTYSIIGQVTKHLQRACPSLPPTTILRMAEGFELHIRARATSRQDYVNRVNAGLIILLESAKNGTLTFMPGMPTGQGPLSPATLQGNPSEGSQYHSRVPTSQFMGNGQEAYSALARTMQPIADYSAATMATADAPVATNIDLSVQAQDIDIAATASNNLHIDTYTATTGVSPATAEIGSQIPSGGPISGQHPFISTASTVATPASQHKDVTLNYQHDQTESADKKKTDSPPDPEETKSKVRSKRRKSRAQAPRQPKKALSALPNGQEATRPTTRSRARKNTKRPSRKRSTRGKKPAVKLSEPPPEENDNDKSSPHNTQPGQTCSRAEVPGASPSHLGGAEETRGKGMKQKGDIVLKIAEEHINQKRNPSSRKSPLASPTLGSDLQHHPKDGRPGLSTRASNIATAQSITHPNVSLAAGGSCVDVGSQRKSILSNPVPIPIEGEEGPSTAISASNFAHIPLHSSTSAEREAIAANVRFFSNGDIEIDDGIRVSKEQIIIAAATLGVMLTTSQLQCLKKSQALMILVKASQHEMVQTNGMMRFLGPSPNLDQTILEEDPRHVVEPYMTDTIHSKQHPRSTHPHVASPAPQPPNQPGPISSNEQGNFRQGISMTKDTELSEQPIPVTAQTSLPMWRFASTVPEVQARLRKFQMDYRKYLSLMQQQLLGTRARTNDNFLRYLRCCISLLAMNPTQVRGVSVEVIDSIERFLNNFLSQSSHLTVSEIRQPSQTVPVKSRAESGRMPMSNLDTPDFGPSASKNAQRSDLQSGAEKAPLFGPPHATNSAPVQPSPCEDILLPSEMSNGDCTNIALGSTNSLHVNGTEHQAYVESDTDLDQITSIKSNIQNGSETNGRKRKHPSNFGSEKSGRCISAQVADGLSDFNTGENVMASRKRYRIHGEVESNTQVAPAEVIDITDETRPPTGVAVYCQQDTNGNIFNLVRLSDRPDLEEVLQRLRFMLNCTMKLTTCYISVSEGREEDNSRRLEEVVVSLEPKKVTSNSDGSEGHNQPAGTNLSMVDLINAECAEARKRYGSLTVQMMEEFRRPVFRGILRYNERPFPKLELRVAGSRKGEPEVRGYERPPMGWVGVLEQVRKLFCSSLESGRGVEELISRWIRSKDDFNRWMELRQRAEDK